MMKRFINEEDGFSPLGYLIVVVIAIVVLTPIAIYYINVFSENVRFDLNRATSERDITNTENENHCKERYGEEYIYDPISDSSNKHGCVINQ